MSGRRPIWPTTKHISGNVNPPSTYLPQFLNDKQHPMGPALSIYLLRGNISRCQHNCHVPKLAYPVNGWLPLPSLLSSNAIWILNMSQVQRQQPQTVQRTCIVCSCNALYNRQLCHYHCTPENLTAHSNNGQGCKNPPLMSVVQQEPCPHQYICASNHYAQLRLPSSPHNPPNTWTLLLLLLPPRATAEQNCPECPANCPSTTGRTAQQAIQYINPDAAGVPKATTETVLHVLPTST